MAKLKFKFLKFSLPFNHTFTISRGSKTHQDTFIIELDFMGIKGYGEAPSIAYYEKSNITRQMMLCIDKRKNLEGYAFTTPDRYWHYLHHLMPGENFLTCAFDMAAWDIFGKMRGVPLHRLWGIEKGAGPVTDYTIGIDTIDNMVAKLKEKPWPLYKIKLGTREDIAIIEALRKHTDAPFHVDANAAWNLSMAREIIPHLHKLGVEMIEQPLSRKSWSQMAELYRESPIPLIADEDCVSEEDVEKCAGHFHGINIKLTKCSGITPALRMIKKAKALNLKVMMGCMNESTIGSAAVAHFIPMLDYLDVDGPLLLAEDLASGISYDYGRVTIADTPGLGITVNDAITLYDEALERDRLSRDHQD